MGWLDGCNGWRVGAAVLVIAAGCENAPDAGIDTMQAGGDDDGDDGDDDDDDDDDA